MDHVATVVARGAGQHLRRHHRPRRVRCAAGDCGGADAQPARAGGGAPGWSRCVGCTAHPGGAAAPHVRHRGSGRGAAAYRCDHRERATMINTLSRATPVIVQGITGRMGRTHAALMRAYGTNIVGGTSGRTDVREVAGVPIFASVAEAVSATGAVASVAMAPPEDTWAAVQQALEAGIKLVVTVAEGVPLHDALRIGRVVRQAGATWVGASSPGLAVPGECKLGFLPDVCLSPGSIGIMSK